MAFLDDTAGRHTLSTDFNASYPADEPYADQSTKKYGNSSAAFQNWTNTRYPGIQAADSDDWYFDGDFTIQFWANIIDNYNWSDQGFLTQAEDSGNIGWSVLLHDAGVRFWFAMNDGVNTQLQWTGGGSDFWVGTGWHHICVTRSASNFYLYVDGTQRHTLNKANPAVNKAARLNIGRRYPATEPTDTIYGWIDDIHIEKGSARYTGASFTPEEQFVDTNTVFLAKFDVDLYEIGGTLSHNSRIIVTDESSRDVEYDAVESAGSYAITATDTSEKTVVAVRESDGKSISYGRVIPTIV